MLSETTILSDTLSHIQSDINVWEEINSSDDWEREGGGDE